MTSDLVYIMLLVTTGSVAIYLAGGVGVFLCLLFWYTKNFDYWRVRGVPYLEPHWFFGSVKDASLREITWVQFCCRAYQRFKINRFCGLFVLRNPALMIFDPALIETVLAHDFESFHDRVLDNQETLANSPFFVSGDKWRAMRFKLIPAFTTKKIKESFQQVLRCSDSVLSSIDDLSAKKEAVEIEPIIFPFAVDAISSCAFGVQIMSDTEEGRAFRKTMDMIFHNIPKLDLMKIFIFLIAPKVARLLGIRTINDKVTSFFVNYTKSTIRYRLEKKVQRNDFLQMLLTLKELEDNGADIDESALSNGESNLLTPNGERLDLPSGSKIFTEDCIASLMYNFMTVAPNPSTGIICYALFEVAKNPVVQRTLAEEIGSAVSKHGWTYEAVRDMTYLDQVLQETLRLYNFNPSLLRTLNRPYKLPGSDVILDKGMQVFIPVAAIHLDPDLYPSPEEFIPERFVGHNYKPTTSFMPFGYGPRICISIRYAVILMKVVVARILHKYTVGLGDKTRLPLQFEQFSYILKVKGGIWLTFSKLPK